MILRKVTQLNNEGITALNQGNGDCAVEKLSHALQLVRDEILPPAEESPHSSTMDTQYLYNEMSLDVGITAEFVEVSTMHHTPDDVLASTAVALAAVPSAEVSIKLEVAGLPVSRWQQSVLDDPRFSAMLIFNLGLALHFQSMNKKNDKQRYARKAAKLYVMLLPLLEEQFAPQIAGSMSTDGPTVVAVLKLAAINNLAQILISLGEYDAAQAGLDDGMRSFLQECASGQSTITVAEPCIQRLITSAIALLLCASSMAAPAA